MPAPPSSAQTAAKNASQTKSSLASSGAFGGANTGGGGGVASKPAGVNKSGPGSTGGSKTPSKPSAPGGGGGAKKSAPAAPAAKAPSKPSGGGSQSPKGPAASLAASKANAAAKTSIAKKPSQPVAPSSNKFGSNSSQSGAVKPQSIQGMINSQTGRGPAASLAASKNTSQGLYGKFRTEQQTPNWQTAPNASVMGSDASRSAMAPGGWMGMTKTPDGYESSFVNKNQVNAFNWSGGFANKFQRTGLMNKPGENLYQAVEDTALRTGQPVTVFSGARYRSGSPNHDPGYAIDNFLRDRNTGVPVGKEALDKMGLGAAASFPIGSKSRTLGTTAAEAKKIQGVLRSPYQQWSNDLFDTVYQNPSMYGTTKDSLRYGGPFGGENPHKSNAADYMHHDVTPNRAQQGTLHANAEDRALNSPVYAGGNFGVGGLNSVIADTTQPPSAPNAAARAPRPVPRPSTFPTGFGDQGIGRPVNPFQASAPPAVKPSDAGIRKSIPGFSPSVPPQAAAPIPNMRPPSQNMTPPQGWSKPPQAFVATDPRVNIPPSGYPQPGNIPDGYFKQFAMTDQDMDGMTKQAMKDFSFGELMEMRKNQDMLPGFMGPITRDMQRPDAAPQVADSPPPVPRMRPPSQNMSPPPGWSPATPRIGQGPLGPMQGPGLPGSQPLPPPQGMGMLPPSQNMSPPPGWSKPAFNDQISKPANPYQAPPSFNDQISKPANPYTAPSSPPFRNYASPDLPPGYADRYLNQPEVTSENPIQGPSNPSQEPEDPRVVQERRDKYRNNGAMIGGAIAGPVGALVGGLLGDQMAKTKPGQRQAIANNPQALNANVQSINRMVDERGGGQKNPEMQVTNTGFYDVLTNPKKVLAEPDNYTNLEEMLASLAEGIDPATGQPL
jgi:hypothetical protein